MRCMVREGFGRVVFPGEAARGPRGSIKPFSHCSSVSRWPGHAVSRASRMSRGIWRATATPALTFFVSGSDGGAVKNSSISSSVSKNEGV